MNYHDLINTLEAIISLLTQVHHPHTVFPRLFPIPTTRSQRQLVTFDKDVKITKALSPKNYYQVYTKSCQSLSLTNLRLLILAIEILGFLISHRTTLNTKQNPQKHNPSIHILDMLLVYCAYSHDITSQCSHQVTCFNSKPAICLSTPTNAIVHLIILIHSCHRRHSPQQSSRPFG